MNMTIQKLRSLAAKSNATLIYNRSTGMYHIQNGFHESEGEIPARDKLGRLHLNEYQLNKLAQCL